MFAVTRPLSSCLVLSLSKPAITPYQAHFRRCRATFTGHGEQGPPVADKELQEWLEMAKTKSWLWRFMHDVEEIENSVSALDFIIRSL